MGVGSGEWALCEGRRHCQLTEQVWQDDSGSIPTICDLPVAKYNWRRLKKTPKKPVDGAECIFLVMLHVLIPQTQIPERLSI